MARAWLNEHLRQWRCEMWPMLHQDPEYKPYFDRLRKQGPIERTLWYGNWS